MALFHILLIALAVFSPSIQGRSIEESSEDSLHNVEKRTTTASGFNYADALHKSILFYEAQRSGVLPATNRIPWRGDSAVDDGSDVGIDLSGGWYGAGDHVKFNFPMSFAVTTLGWGLMEYWDAYEAAGELGNMLDSIRWPCEYLIKCHPSANKYYYGVGDIEIDHSQWIRPEDMDDYNMIRPSWSCTGQCSDVTGEAAAALAVCAINFNKTSSYRDQTFATQCLDKARSLYDMTIFSPGKYTPISNQYGNGTVQYPSSRYDDEMAWAGLWLFLATGTEEYHDKSGDDLANFNGAYYYFNVSNNMFMSSDYALRAKAKTFSWDDKRPGVQLLLWKCRYFMNNTVYENKAQKKINSMMTDWIDTFARLDTGLTISSNLGLDWGSNGHAGRMAWVAMMANKYDLSDASEKAERYAWAKQQIDAILGNGSHSYMVGFGNNPPQRPHHRGSSCPTTGTCGGPIFNSLDPNANELTGAVVGGPDVNGTYVDLLKDYKKNEVTVYYNAGVQNMLAALLHHEPPYEGC